MPREIKITVYMFDDLSAKAKEKARQWYRETLGNDGFHEPVYEDAKQCLTLAGFTLDRIFYSGFSSQGDGACFEGGWKAEDVKPGKLKAHAPLDTTLHRIADEMESIAKRYPSAWMRVKHSGHYYHQYETVFDVVETVDDMPNGAEIPGDVVEAIKETSRDAMEWIYNQLQKEWDFQNSDDTVDENIRANEYEFDVDGRRNRYA